MSTKTHSYIIAWSHGKQYQAASLAQLAQLAPPALAARLAPLALALALALAKQHGWHHLATTSTARHLATMRRTAAHTASTAALQRGSRIPWRACTYMVG